MRRRPRARRSELADPPLPSDVTAFQHVSERQFARLLDFYGIEWEYEPTEFVLARDADGMPLEAFRPDFYLPAHDRYIEITTMSQKLVTRKNRKVRRLMEQRPDVKVTILYQRDYVALLVKYGLEDPKFLARLGLSPDDEPAPLNLA